MMVASSKAKGFSGYHAHIFLVLIVYSHARAGRALHEIPP